MDPKTYVVGSPLKVDTQPHTPKMDREVVLDDLRFILFPPGWVHGNPTFEKAVVNINLGASKKTLAINSDAKVDRIVPANSLQFMPKGTQMFIKGRNELPSCVLEVGDKTLHHWLGTAAVKSDVANNYVDFTPEPVAANLGRAAITHLMRANHPKNLIDRLTIESIALGIGARLAALATWDVAGNRDPALSRQLEKKRIDRAIELIDSKIDESALSLTDLAEAANLSIWHFSRVFRANMGESPYAYVLRRRASHAVDMILGTSIPLAMIAHLSGFGSQSHMNSVVKRFHHVTPGSMRR